jgi:allantoinase
MAELDMAILNGEVATPQGELITADVGIVNGRIHSIAPRGAGHSAKETIDAKGMWVLPGAIDIHWHCRVPGYDVRGDFYTETRAAAAGGVTTVFEMPISNPGCATPATFANRRKKIEEQAIIDVALYGAPGTLIRDDVLGMAQMGAVAFKIFMHRAPLGRDDEFIGICLTEDDQLYEALKLTKEAGRRIVIHAESDSLLEAKIGTLRKAGRLDLAAHMESRPPVVEAVAIARILTLAEDVGAPIHIAHVTSKHALDVVRRFQRDGLDITAETCPHYLFFTQDDYMHLGPYGKVNPPIRTAQDQTALWGGIADGSLSVVTTDHSTFLVEEKERGWGDMWRSPSGAPGVQTLLPGILTTAQQGHISLKMALDLVCTAPARIFNLPQKGRLVVGNDADICIYDPRQPNVFTHNQMMSKARDIDKLYLNKTYAGKVHATLSHGRLVFCDGQVLAEKGSGRFLGVGV